jgi:ABC-2 type transport system ATP-binding protein
MNDLMINAENIKKSFRAPVRAKSGLLASVKNLIKTKYQFTDALKGIDFKVKKGELRGLIGPNGAGKSTFIKILSGVLYPSEGELSVMDYVPWKDRVEYVKKIGVLFGQKSLLWWDLPTIDAYILYKEMYSVSDKDFNYNINYFNEILGIGDIIKKPVRQLSLGERMKCEFACAFIHNPPLIYLDEPTIGLDIISKEAIRSFVKQINRDKKTTIILTTHDLSDVSDLCQTVSIINKGTIVFDDTLSKLQSYYKDRKIIEVEFSHTVYKIEMKNCKVLEADEVKAKIEIDTSHIKIKDMVYDILDKFPVKGVLPVNVRKWRKS